MTKRAAAAAFLFGALFSAPLRAQKTLFFLELQAVEAYWTAASLDLTHVWRNLENRAEIQVGRRDDAGAFLFFWRAGLGLLDESRLKLEVQPVLKRSLGIWDTSLGFGLTYLFSADLAGRTIELRDGRLHAA